MTNEQLMRRLAQTDPFRDVVIDETPREQLWAVIAVTVRDQSRPRQRWPRLHGRSAVIALAAATAVTTGALAATNVIRFGAPAAPTGAFSNPHRYAGAILPHSVRMLPVTAPDPDGGPAWGMRVLSTTRGAGCVQVGRVLDGKLGIVGRDHAFRNDGRFHEIPANSMFNPGGCTALDANGRIFLTVGIDYMPASAMQSCYVLRFFHGTPPGPGCRRSSLRSLYYGLLGPDARAVIYNSGGRTHRLSTVGSEGAYLIVIRAPQQGRCDCVRPGLGPGQGPITAVEYSDGSRCNIPRHGHAYPGAACKPHGYEPLNTALPRREDVRAAVTATLVRTHNHRASVVVTFKARAPITSARDSYIVTWGKGDPARTFYALPTQGDVRAGMTIRKRLVINHAGVYRVTVRLAVGRGPTGPAPIAPGGPDSGLLVGQATVRVP